MLERSVFVVRDLPAWLAGRQQVPAHLVVAVPPAGCPTKSVAKKLDLALEGIHGVLVPHQIYSLDHHLEPGDQVAFIPAGASAVFAVPRYSETLTESRAH